MWDHQLATICYSEFTLSVELGQTTTVSLQLKSGKNEDLEFRLSWFSLPLNLQATSQEGTCE